MAKIKCNKCGKVMADTNKFCDGCGSDMTDTNNRIVISVENTESKFEIAKIFAILSIVCFGIRILLYLGITAFEIIDYSDFLGHVYGIAYEAGFLFIGLYLLFHKK